MIASKNLKNQALFDQISSIDLSRVKAKLIKSNCWTTEKADSVEEIYRVFLYICGTYPGETHVPTSDIDDMWHTHILDTKHYMKDCDNIFGFYLHHTPTINPNEKERRQQWAHFQRMQEKILSEFGNDAYYQVFKSKAGDCNEDTECGAGCGDDAGSRPPPRKGPPGPAPTPNVTQIGTA